MSDTKRRRIDRSRTRATFEENRAWWHLEQRIDHFRAHPEVPYVVPEGNKYTYGWDNPLKRLDYYPDLLK